MKQEFDLIVLGSGSAARDGANKVHAEYGANVALVEHTRWGGSCPNVACKPTKAYLVAAELAHDVDRLASKLGIETGPARTDLARVKARKDSLIVPKETWLERLDSNGQTPFDGVASFLDPHTVARQRRAALSRTDPHRDGLAHCRSAHRRARGGRMDRSRHCAGADRVAGVVARDRGRPGRARARADLRFGSRVTLVQHAARISPRSDVTATDELTAALEEEKVDIRTATTVTRVRREAEEIVVELGGEELHVTQILLAAGRLPNVEELELDRAGIDHTPRGIAVDAQLLTSAEGVWAAGDVTGRHQFTPVAQYEARIAVANMFGGSGARSDYRFLPTVIFTDPELGAVGMTGEDARASGVDDETAVHPIRYVQRASYTDTKHGLYKLIWERETRRILGIHVVCRNAGDVIRASRWR